jgi:hypothetical protein
LSVADRCSTVSSIGPSRSRDIVASRSNFGSVDANALAAAARSAYDTAVGAAARSTTNGRVSTPTALPSRVMRARAT